MFRAQREFLKLLPKISPKPDAVIPRDLRESRVLRIVESPLRALRELQWDVGVDTSRLSRVPDAADCGPLHGNRVARARGCWRLRRSLWSCNCLWRNNRSTICTPWSFRRRCLRSRWKFRSSCRCLSLRPIGDTCTRYPWASSRRCADRIWSSPLTSRRCRRPVPNVSWLTIRNPRPHPLPRSRPFRVPRRRPWWRLWPPSRRCTRWRSSEVSRRRKVNRTADPPVVASHLWSPPRISTTPSPCPRSGSRSVTACSAVSAHLTSFETHKVLLRSCWAHDCLKLSNFLKSRNTAKNGRYGKSRKRENGTKAALKKSFTMINLLKMYSMIYADTSKEQLNGLRSEPGYGW